MWNKKIVIIYIIIIIFVIISLFYKLESKASTSLSGIENFPSSYQPYLKELKEKHPNWNFTALYTNLDWDYVIKEESVFGRNLVPKNYSDSWKNTTPGQYDVEVDSGWVDSSTQAVEYCMDPRNFLNEVRIFQFETLSYDPYNNLDVIEKILYGTEFYETKVSYLNSNGNTINMNEKYSDLILKAAKTSNVSAYHLASRIKQEVGPFLSHSSISGKVDGFKGLYNFYNIGATSSSEPMGAIKNGLQYAKDGKGASEATKKKYLIPWNTKEKAITGGAIFIGESYINAGQNTIYLQKFDVNDEGGNGLFWHQYMTNVLAPYSESKSIYNGYKNTGILDSPITFVIPVFNNMPNIPTDSPSINKSDFTSENKRVYCNATNVNIRTGPSTSYEIITTVSKPDKMTRILKGKQSGDKWDKVILENGIVGYIFQSYVSEFVEIPIEKIDLSLENNVLQKGEKKQIEITILPFDANVQDIKYSSSNPDVAIVDSKGLIYAVSSGKTTITVKDEISGVQNKIDIEVYSKVTGISIDQKDIYLSVGDKLTVDAVIEPDDANNKNILYKCSNQDIATIDKSGMITANKEGKAIITAYSEEDESIKAECDLTIVRKLDDSEIKFGDDFKVDGAQITGINYEKNTVQDIKNNISTSLDIEIVNYKNESLKDTDLVGSGSKIYLKENGIVLREYVVILYGDCNGDGRINSVDLLVLQRHILEIQIMDSVFVKAANVRKTAKKPTSVDLLLIQRHILKLQILEQ